MEGCRGYLVSGTRPLAPGGWIYNSIQTVPPPQALGCPLVHFKRAASPGLFFAFSSTLFSLSFSLSPSSSPRSISPSTLNGQRLHHHLGRSLPHLYRHFLCYPANRLGNRAHHEGLWLYGTRHLSSTPVAILTTFWQILALLLPKKPVGQVIKEGLPGHAGIWPEWSAPLMGDSRSPCPGCVSSTPPRGAHRHSFSLIWLD